MITATVYRQILRPIHSLVIGFVNCAIYAFRRIVSSPTARGTRSYVLPVHLNRDRGDNLSPDRYVSAR